MKRILTMTTLVSAAALGLAACDSEDVENTPVDDIDEIVDDSNDEAYPVGGDLSEDQQASLDAMDSQSISDEYDRNMANMQTEMESGGGASDGSMGGATMSGSGSTDSDETSSDSSTSGSGTTSAEGAMNGTGSSMPSRSKMTFGYLDRNDDGKLSVAEYAIWALPTDPNPPEPNDALGPHLTQDQINEAGQTFFFFDDDGDTYLSQDEFQDARNSGRVG